MPRRSFGLATTAKKPVTPPTFRVWGGTPPGYAPAIYAQTSGYMMAVLLDLALFVLESSERFKRFQELLQTVCEYGHTIFSAVVGRISELQAENVHLQDRYRQLKEGLKKCYDKVLEYIDIVDNHPVCDEERKKRINEELSSNKDSKLDLEDEGRFAETIGFLRDLGRWLGDVNAKLDQVKALFDDFDGEVREASTRAQKAEYEARTRRMIALGCVGTSGFVAATGAGVLISGGPRLESGLMLTIGGSVALWSYLTLSSFQEQEHDSCEFKFKVRCLTRGAEELQDITRKVKEKMRVHALSIKRKDAIHQPPPVVNDIMGRFFDIFKILEFCGNFKNEKKKAKDHLLLGVNADY